MLKTPAAMLGIKKPRGDLANPRHKKDGGNDPSRSCKGRCSILFIIFINP